MLFFINSTILLTIFPLLLYVMYIILCSAYFSIVSLDIMWSVPGELKYFYVVPPFLISSVFFHYPVMLSETEH